MGGNLGWLGEKSKQDSLGRIGQDATELNVLTGC